MPSPRPSKQSLKQRERMKKRLQGPDGIILELDSSEIKFDEPGNGHPVTVEFRNGFGNLTGVIMLGYVFGPEDDEIHLPFDCLEWLDSNDVTTEIEQMFAAGPNGEW